MRASAIGIISTPRSWNKQQSYYVIFKQSKFHEQLSFSKLSLIVTATSVVSKVWNIETQKLRHLLFMFHAPGGTSCVSKWLGFWNRSSCSCSLN